MSERRPGLPEVIRRHVQGEIRDVHTSIPARVTKVTLDGGKPKYVDVQPLVQRAWVDEEGVRQVAALPVIAGVPIAWPGAGPFRITMPVSDGSLVIGTDTIPATIGKLTFFECSVDRWLTGDGAIVDPEIDHSHALADAVFEPGLRPFGAPLATYPTDHATIGHDSGVQIHFRKGTITIGDESGSDFIALAGKAKANDDALYNLLDGVFGASSTPLVSVTPGSPDPVYVKLKAALAAALLAGTLPPASVAAGQGKTK